MGSLSLYSLSVSLGQSLCSMTWSLLLCFFVSVTGPFCALYLCLCILSVQGMDHQLCHNNTDKNYKDSLTWNWGLLTIAMWVTILEQNFPPSLDFRWLQPLPTPTAILWKVLSYLHPLQWCHTSAAVTVWDSQYLLSQAMKIWNNCGTKKCNF